MKIVTGYVGEKHITSNDDQGLLQGIFGTGCYILPVRGRLSATLISSNELQIADGEGILQGVHFRVEPGTNDSVTIENGSQGMQRIDLICARYEKNTESGVESMSWINHKGTEAASNPEQPSYTAGDLLAGDTLAEFPVYAVRLNGLTVQSVTQMATILSPQALIGNNSISGIGDGTITGALSALNASLSVQASSRIQPTAEGINSSDSSVYIYVIGKIMIIYYNIAFTSVTANVEREICNISEYGSPRIKTNFTTCNQAGQGYLIQVKMDGSITIYAANHTGTAMVRGTLAFPLA